MSQQLIINVLGAAKVGMLSQISACVNDLGCNILDSRQAIYGKDFSLTMIVEGSANAITRLELSIANLCVQLDLLSMVKRTSGHHKQNIEQIVQLDFSGKDTVGLLNRITAFISSHHITISALRQKTYGPDENKNEEVRCKMVLSAPKNANLVAFDEEIKALMQELSLSGKITHNTLQENNEHIESW